MQSHNIFQPEFFGEPNILNLILDYLEPWKPVLALVCKDSKRLGGIETSSKERYETKFSYFAIKNVTVYSRVLISLNDPLINYGFVEYLWISHKLRSSCVCEWFLKTKFINESLRQILKNNPEVKLHSGFLDFYSFCLIRDCHEILRRGKKVKYPSARGLGEILSFPNPKTGEYLIRRISKLLKVCEELISKRFFEIIYYIVSLGVLIAENNRQYFIKVMIEENMIPEEFLKNCKA